MKPLSDPVQLQLSAGGGGNNGRDYLDPGGRERAESGEADSVRVKDMNRHEASLSFC